MPSISELTRFALHEIFKKYRSITSVNIKVNQEKIKQVRQGRTTKFGVLFKDSSKQIVNQVVYSFKVTTSDGKVIQDKQNQRAGDGTGIQMVNIPTAGQISVKVSIDVVAGRPSGEFIESATFNLVAT